MLVDLSVKDFALIPSANVKLDEKFNVLTGETGAGKSIIIDAVSLLLGARASHGDIRIGAAKAVVEGVFLPKENHSVYAILAQMGLEVDQAEPLVLSREIAQNGKNICRINQRVVTLANFRSVGTALINIYGQHDYQSISDSSQHILLLDRLGDEAFQKQREVVAERYLQAQKKARKLKQIRDLMKERGERMEILRLKAKELAKLQGISTEKEKEMEDTLREWNRKEKLAEYTKQAYQMLYLDEKSVYHMLQDVNHVLERSGNEDEQLAQIGKNLQDAYYVIEDAVHILSNYAENTEEHSEQKEQLEERLYSLQRLKKKYGLSTEEILHKRDEVLQEIAMLENLDIIAQESKQAYLAAKKDFQQEAEKISLWRKEIAAKFEREMEKNLRELSMQDVRFEVHFGDSVNTALGIDNIVFMFSANIGQPLKPLSQIASGGEMSRIMLAFKTILAQYDEIETIIFDEIDTGIGGNIVVKVAEKLAQTSQWAQVICVTHAPQIAAAADTHYCVKKESSYDETVTSISRLNDEARLHEIARMLGGKEAYQLSAAKAMLVHNGKL